MLVAGDIGGTKTLLGIFDHSSARPRPVVVRSFGTLEYDDLTTMVAALLSENEATAYSIPVLQDNEVHVLQRGEPVEGGNIALIAAGTGLGEALLHNVDGRY